MTRRLKIRFGAPAKIGLKKDLAGKRPKIWRSFPPNLSSPKDFWRQASTASTAASTLNSQSSTPPAHRCRSLVWPPSMVRSASEGEGRETICWAKLLDGVGEWEFREIYWMHSICCEVQDQRLMSYFMHRAFETPSSESRLGKDLVISMMFRVAVDSRAWLLSRSTTTW